MRSLKRLALLALVLACAPNEAAAATRPFTVRDGVETTRPINFDGGSLDPIYRSPDARRYLLILATGDLTRNGLWVDFVTGRTDSLADARPRIVRRLFTPALGGNPVTVNNQLAWFAEGRRVAFIWEDDKGTKQVFSLDLEDGELTQLTRHSTPVVQFTVSPDGSALLYSAFAPYDESKNDELRRDGYAVSSTSAYSFLAGDLDGWDRWEHVELFLLPRGEVKPSKLPVPGRRGVRYCNLLEFSPDSKRVILDLPVTEAPENWGRYTEHWLRSIGLPAVRSGEPNAVLRRFYVVDVVTASIRPLWDAPRFFQERVAWSPDGTRLMIGPTFEPVDRASEAGLDARALVDVDVRTGDFVEARPSARTTDRAGLQPLRWNGRHAEIASVQNPSQTQWVSKQGGQWRPTVPPPRSRDEKGGAAVRVYLRQGLNTPPTLFGVEDGTRREAELLRVNPTLLQGVRLGQVELVHWRSTDDRPWSGLLYRPVGEARGRASPLVVQAKPFSPTDFSLLGSDRYPTVFAAQALANRGMAVLQMGFPDEDGKKREPVAGTPNEARAFLAGLEGAIAHLEASGVIDESKIGLTGFSRTGWYVQYALAHSQFPFAAALTADNIDASYMQSAFTGWPHEIAMGNGGLAFGDTLAKWLTEAPGFNAERIRTPLRLQVNSVHESAAISHWEIFSRLRALKRPVELYVIPDVRNGTHNLQNPRQVLASQDGAVDWFDFWLNGHEDPAPSKAGQYVRWRALQEKDARPLRVKAGPGP